MQPPAPGCRGLTLLEIVVAMTILAMGLLVLMSGFAEGGRARRSAQLLTRATLLAGSMMEERLRESDGKEGSAEGEWEGSPGFRWRFETRPFERPAEQPAEGSRPREEKLLEAVLTATWPDPAGEKSLVLRTLIPAAETE